MSEITMIGPIPEETENLRLHVDLCAQRYNQLISKFDEVDERLDRITIMCEEIKQKLGNDQKETYLRYLTWAGVIISILVGVVVTLSFR
jgi:tetrahydromethanopterin S-methyltransferase subunit G